MIDMMDWMMEVGKIYEQCKSEEDVEGVTKWMILYLESKEDIAKEYVSMGLL